MASDTFMKHNVSKGPRTEDPRHCRKLFQEPPVDIVSFLEDSVAAPRLEYVPPTAPESEDMGQIMCKICYQTHNPITEEADIISPCGCKGSIKYVHHTCLKMWRFRGKRISNIRKCEQCHCDYVIEGDLNPHKCLLNVTTFSTICLLTIFVLNIVNSFTETVAFLTEKNEMRDIRLRVQSMMLQKERQALAEKEGYHRRMRFVDWSAPSPNIAVYQLTSTSAVIILILLYNLLFHFKVVPFSNYLFTLWRLYTFDFFIDRIIFFVFSAYYLKRMYLDIYKNADAIYVYILNFKRF